MPVCATASFPSGAAGARTGRTASFKFPEERPVGGEHILGPEGTPGGCQACCSQACPGRVAKEAPQWKGLSLSRGKSCGEGPGETLGVQACCSCLCLTLPGVL